MFEILACYTGNPEMRGRMEIEVVKISTESNLKIRS